MATEEDTEVSLSSRLGFEELRRDGFVSSEKITLWILEDEEEGRLVVTYASEYGEVLFVSLGRWSQSTEKKEGKKHDYLTFNLFF